MRQRQTISPEVAFHRIIPFIRSLISYIQLYTDSYGPVHNDNILVKDGPLYLKI